MSNSATIVNDLLGRYDTGHPLFTMKVAADELAALRRLLADAVAAGGLDALRAPAHARMFVVYAAELLCQEGLALRWRPILQSLDVEPEDAARYPTLYDAVVDALRRFDRGVVTRPSGRRFLATLLREGGLPVHIGNLPDLIGALGREIGWEALAGPEGMATRRFAVQRIKGMAQGRLRELLDVEEAAEALEDILADAAATRDRLARCGVDPTRLAAPEDVQRALEEHGIALPGARNGKLLSAILASFRDAARAPRPATSTAPGGILELRAHLIEGSRIELRASLDLNHPALRAGLPPDVTFATVAVEPGGAACLIEWSEGKRTFESDEAGDGRLDWRAGAESQPATLVARYAVRGAAPEVVALATLELPDQPLWWFDGDGRLLPADDMVLAAGQRRLLWARDEGDVEVFGAVTAKELSGGGGSAWLFHATGEGTAQVVTAGGEATIECRKRLLAVSTVGALPSQHSRATHAVERLPDLIVEDATAVVALEVSAGAGGAFQTVAREATGPFRLSALPQLRNACGAVQVRLSARDGRMFRARWTVIPPQVVELIEARRVVFRDKRLAHVQSPLGTVTRLAPGRVQVEAHGDAQEVVADLGFDTGEVVSVRVRLARRWVRLWRDILARDEAPLDGSAVLTEGMVFAHACLEAHADADREVWLEDEGGTRLVTSRTDHHGRALVPLRDVVRLKCRPGESIIAVTARVDGDAAAYRFKVLVPRMARPTRVTRAGELALQLLLDERDLPAKPALACFDVLRPFDAPAIVPCALAPTGPQRFEAAVPAERLPSSRGRWIVLLVDAALEPVRSLSGALLVEIPLDVPAVQPRALSPLEEALWDLNEPGILEALEALTADLPAFEVWLERFVSAARARARFGLAWFYLFDIIAARAPWLLLAAVAKLPPRARFAWLDLYRSELRGFSWLGFARSERRPLARVLRRKSPEDVIALVEAAKQACPMPRAIELFIYLDALDQRPEATPFLAALREEMFGSLGPLALPRDWVARLALPMRDLGEAPREGLRGHRAAALFELRWGTSLSLLERLPREHAFEAHGVAPSIAPRLIEDEARKKGVPAEGHGAAVLDAEKRVAAAAHLLTQYRERGARLNKPTWNAVRDVERSVPDLLDVWLLAFMGKG